MGKTSTVGFTEYPGLYQKRFRVLRAQFVEIVIEAVEKLERFPEMERSVPEAEEPNIRELLFQVVVKGLIMVCNISFTKLTSTIKTWSLLDRYLFGLMEQPQPHAPQRQTIQLQAIHSMSILLSREPLQL